MYMPGDCRFYVTVYMFNIEKKKKENKLQNCCDVLIVVTKCSKFGSGTTTVYGTAKLLYGCIQFFVIILYLLKYQS